MVPRSFFPQTLGLRDVLLRYATGDYAVGDRLHVINVASAQKDLERLTPSQLAGPALTPEVARRALAAFALEIARAEIGTQPDATRTLVDWARRSFVVGGSAGEFERRWHDAAIALLRASLKTADLQTESELALKQFPGEARFVLARSLVDELKLLFVIENDPQKLNRQLATALAQLGQASRLTAVHVEAGVRSAYLELRFQRYTEALALLDDVQPQISGDLAFVATLFRARCLAGLGRWPESETAYAAALTLAPDASSATAGLLVALRRQGRATESQDLANRLLTGSKTFDPWTAYWTGEPRLWRTAISALREAIR